MTRSSFGVCRVCGSVVPRKRWRDHLESHNAHAASFLWHDVAASFADWEPRNSNCLQGMVCPECGSEGSFDIMVSRVEEVSDDGTDCGGGDTEWDDRSYCRCRNCGNEGRVRNFTLKETT